MTYFTDLVAVFNNGFPSNYINDVKGWGLSKEQLHQKLYDGTYKLLTMDIDFGKECSLHCPHCFRKSKELDTLNSDMCFTDIKELLIEGKKLGLKSIKILGAGEPFENPEFLKFLYFVREIDIDVAIFTKGHVLGSDTITKIYFGNAKIHTAKELVEILNDLGVSILLGFNSFHRDIQEDFVGLKKKKWKYDENYVDLRNNALRNLIDAGFNNYIPGEATRLALIAAPIKPTNVSEIFEIYKWGRLRNIYVLSCPTTYSGMGRKEFKKEQAEYIFSDYLNSLNDLYFNIYKWNIETGLMTLDDFVSEGVSLYPGAHPCNQVAAGFYVTLKGKVIRCPGRDTPDFEVVHNIREHNLKDIWVKSENYTLASQSRFNYQCIARDGFFFNKESDFYNKIYDRVLNYFRYGAR